MRKQDSHDPWMDESRDRKGAWEPSLRPSRSHSSVWLLVGAITAAVVVYLVFQSWPGSAYFRSSGAVQTAPAKAADIKSQPAQQSEPSQMQPAPRVQRFAKCVSPAGAVTYSDGACPADTKGGEVLVRPDLNLADGMSEEARQASMRRNSAIAESVAEHERQVAMNVDSAVSECAQLNALIASIDAVARQPLPAAEQDRLKDQRRRARDRQHALRC